MTKPVRFARDARDEVLEAARWYERQRGELRAEFLASLDEAVERLTRLSRGSCRDDLRTGRLGDPRRSRPINAEPAIPSRALSAHLAPVRGLDPALGVKRLHLKRFPYALIFVESTDRIEVIAVAHHRKKPFYWRHRR